MNDKAFCQHTYFFKPDADPIIVIDFHTHKSNNGRMLKNVCFNITPKGAEFEIEISMPERDFRKLIIAGLKFLDGKKDVQFYKDKFRIGEKFYPAADALRELPA